MAKTHEKRTPRDLLRIVFRRRSLFFFGAALFMIVSNVGAHYVPLKYTGVTKFERRNDAAAEQVSGKTPTNFEAMKMTLQLELSGYNAVTKVVEDLGLTKGMPHGPDGQLTQAGQAQKQELANDLLKRIAVSWEASSEPVDVISVSFTHDDPSLAERLPNLLVENYINRVSEQIQERLTASRDFLLGQVRDGNQRLEEIAKAKIDFEAKHEGMPESPNALYENIQKQETEIGSVRRQLDVAKQKLSRLLAMKGVTTTTSSSQPVMVIKQPNPEVKRVGDQLREAQDQLATIKATGIKPKHPSYVVLTKKIADLERRLKDIPPEIEAPIMSIGNSSNADELTILISGAQSEVQVFEQSLERMQAQLTRLQALMVNIWPVLQQYRQILKQQEERQAETSRWAQRLTDIQMSLAAEVAKRGIHLKTVQAAQTQNRPSSPSLSRVMLFAILGGLCFGAGLVFLANALDRSITTSEDAVRHFDVPVYGAVGEIVTDRDLLMGRLKRWVLTPIAGAVILAVIALTGLSVYLWLEAPPKYQEWRASPVSFLYRELTAPIGKTVEGP